MLSIPRLWRSRTGGTLIASRVIARGTFSNDKDKVSSMNEVGYARISRLNEMWLMNVAWHGWIQSNAIISIYIYILYHYILYIYLYGYTMIYIYLFIYCVSVKQKHQFHASRCESEPIHWQLHTMPSALTIEQDPYGLRCGHKCQPLPANKNNRSVSLLDNDSVSSTVTTTYYNQQMRFKILVLCWRIWKILLAYESYGIIRPACSDLFCLLSPLNR